MRPYRSCDTTLSFTKRKEPMTEPRNDMGNRPSNLFERLRAALIERYDLRELVGRGGMGAVYRGAGPSTSSRR